FADIEHRRFVALAFADDDAALHRHGVERRAHGVDGGLVGGLLIAPAGQLGGRDRGGDRHARCREREIVGEVLHEAAPKTWRTLWSGARRAVKCDRSKGYSAAADAALD